MRITLGCLFALLVASGASASPFAANAACAMVCRVVEVPYVPSLGPPRSYDEWVVDRWAPETVMELVCEAVHPPVLPPVGRTPPVEQTPPTEVTEPSTWVLLGAGLGLVGWKARRA